MNELLHFPAGRTFSAGIIGSGACTKDVLGVGISQSQRAVSGFPGKKLGMANPPRLYGTEQPLLYFFMSDNVLEHCL